MSNWMSRLPFLRYSSCHWLVAHMVLHVWLTLTAGFCSLPHFSVGLCPRPALWSSAFVSIVGKLSVPWQRSAFVIIYSTSISTHVLQHHDLRLRIGTAVWLHTPPLDRRLREGN